MSSRSGLHRDLRPQAAGDRHLATRLTRQSKWVKGMSLMPQDTSLPRGPHPRPKLLCP